MAPLSLEARAYKGNIKDLTSPISHQQCLTIIFTTQKPFNLQVLKALAGTAVPVPKVLCLCTDDSVIGTAFYVMEHVEGRIFLDPGLPEVSPSVRRTMYEEMAKTLAAIHAVDVDRVGLSRFGRRDNYCKRQVCANMRAWHLCWELGLPYPFVHKYCLEVRWLKKLFEESRPDHALQDSIGN